MGCSLYETCNILEVKFLINENDNILLFYRQYKRGKHDMTCFKSRQTVSAWYKESNKKWKKYKIEQVLMALFSLLRIDQYYSTF